MILDPVRQAQSRQYPLFELLQLAADIDASTLTNLTFFCIFRVRHQSSDIESYTVHYHHHEHKGSNIAAH